MRKILLITVASLAVTAAAALAQTPAPASPAAATKIGYINAQAVMAGAPGSQEARTTIERETNKHRADLALADDSIQNMVVDYQKKQLAMSKEARDAKENEIRTKQKALQDRADRLEQQMRQREQDLLKPIMDKVNAVLADMRKEGGYALILDTSTGAVVSADPGLDLTEQVLTRLKASAPAAVATPKKP